MSDKCPKCDVCESGGISSYDCPNCHHKWKGYYEVRIRELEQQNAALNQKVERLNGALRETAAAGITLGNDTVSAESERDRLREELEHDRDWMASFFDDQDLTVSGKIDNYQLGWIEAPAWIVTRIRKAALRREV